MDKIIMKMNKLSMKKQSGFTLTEMMIVIAIIGILSAIALPQYNNYVERGDMAEIKKIMIATKQAYERNKLSNPTGYATKGQQEVALGTILKDNLPTRITNNYNVYVGVHSGSSDTTTGAATYITFTANPKSKARKKSVFLTKNGDAYRCTTAISVTSNVSPATKGSSCTEAF